jgi:hypothetical protein
MPQASEPVFGVELHTGWGYLSGFAQTTCRVGHVFMTSARMGGTDVERIDMTPAVYGNYGHKDTCERVAEKLSRFLGCEITHVEIPDPIARRGR